MNDTELILDADADTSITTDTDDQIHIKIANTDHLQTSGSSNDTLNQWDTLKILRFNSLIAQN